MKSAFNPIEGTWNIEWPGRISRHDVVYLTPPDEPLHGMPIGNGEVGALCWFEPSRIMIVVNKSDLWDDAAFGRFINWKGDDEERNTTLRHGGRIIIDFHAPVFDLFYLSDCQGRISLADASVQLGVTGPLGAVDFRAFVNHDDGVLCCEVESDRGDDTPVEITVERYGSRMFHHWYASVNSDACPGLAGTDSRTDGQGAYVTHKLTGGTFALGCRVLPQEGPPAAYTREGAHHAVCRLAGTQAKEFSLLATITPPLQEDPVPAARTRLDAAASTGIPGMFAAHSGAWKAFWLRSLMESGNDFLDNLWHLDMYYANGSQRGSYPGRFIGGLWNAYRDFQAWGYYFHWNQQQIYWPLNAAGHHDLVDSYLDLRFNGLPHAKEDARDVFGADGAAVSDVTERRGYNSQLELDNHTPVAQIALDFWRQYRYTGDEVFLKERALPYMREAAAFFETLFEKSEDGRYHAHKGTGYEGGFLLRDVITEISAGRALFSAVLEALDQAGLSDPRSARWRDIRDNLAPMMTLTAREDMMEPRDDGSFVLTQGKFSGEPTPANKMLAAGYGIEQGRVYCSLEPRDAPEPEFTEEDQDKHIHRRPLLRMHFFLQKLAAGNNPYVQEVPALQGPAAIFPYCEYAAIFPSGLIGVSQKGTELYKAAVNTVKLYASTVIGWDPMPIVLARLGLGRELASVFSFWPDFQCMYANGMVGDGPQDIAGSDAPLVLRTFFVHDPTGEPRTWHAARKLFKCTGMEAPSVLSTALNESLLQSHDGTIRVGPALSDGQHGRFTLHATDGFVVSAELEKGKPRWTSVESRLGRFCRMENPWPKAFLYRDGTLLRCFDQELVEFPTGKCERFMLVPEQSIVEQWETQPAAFEPNTEPKTSSNGVIYLGLPRMF